LQYALFCEAIQPLPAEFERFLYTLLHGHLQQRKFFSQFLLIRHGKFRSITGRRSTKICDIIRNRYIRFMADSRNHRNFRIKNCPRHALIVESPEILHGTTAASGNDQIGYLIAVCVADRARNLSRCFHSLHAYGQKLNLCQRITLCQNAEHVHNRCARGGSDDSNGMRVFGQRLFMRRIEQPFLREFFFQLLECDIQIAHAIGRYIAAIQLIRAVARKNCHTAIRDHLHAVFRFET